MCRVSSKRLGEERYEKRFSGESTEDDLTEPCTCARSIDSNDLFPISLYSRISVAEKAWNHIKR